MKHLFPFRAWKNSYLQVKNISYDSKEPLTDTYGSKINNICK